MSEVKPHSHFGNQVSRSSYEFADPFASLNGLPRTPHASTRSYCRVAHRSRARRPACDCVFCRRLRATDTACPTGSWRRSAGSTALVPVLRQWLLVCSATGEQGANSGLSLTQGSGTARASGHYRHRRDRSSGAGMDCIIGLLDCWSNIGAVSRPM
jgi:hypothetical protein